MSSQKIKIEGELLKKRNSVPRPRAMPPSMSLCCTRSRKK